MIAWNLKRRKRRRMTTKSGRHTYRSVWNSTWLLHQTIWQWQNITINKYKRKIFNTDNTDTKTDINTNIPSIVNTNISNTFEDEESETRIQERQAQHFLRKHVDNDNLYIFPNIYKSKGEEIFILLNIPQDKESFQDFVFNNYVFLLSNQHCITNFNNFKEYYTNILQSVNQIIDEVTIVFVKSGFTSVKIQLRFGVIW
jgi:hypothetical protein